MLPPKQAREPLDRLRLGEIVAERLGEWVTERQLKPGDRLPSEPELALHFGVARTVVREALSKLKTLGVIEVYQGRGAFVSQLPVELLFMRVRRLNPKLISEHHLWELREILETRGAELAAERRTKEDIGALEVAIRNHDHEPRLGGVENERFHRALAHAAQNPILEELVAELVTLSSGFLEVAHRSDPNRVTQARAEHAGLLEAVRAGDGGGASAIMRAHLRSALSWFPEELAPEFTPKTAGAIKR
jgi:GntR family transcriptional regulator, transcriptional repressor for pyruvate dehydrogenase complex